MAANSDLRYDSDVFETAINNYTEARSKFINIKNTLNNCIDSLRSGWQTQAGDTFFQGFENDLSPALDKYINFMTYMIECLAAAKRSYDTVVDKAESIRY